MKILLIVSVLFLSQQTFAKDAGCGLGDLAIQKNSKLSQLFAVTTNHVTMTQVFGITTGTSNCSASGIVMADKEAQYFAETNLPNLKVDFARGTGDSLTTLASILGCEESSVGAFGELMQSRYSEIFYSQNVSAQEFVQAVKLEVIREPSVAHACSSI